MYEQLFLYRTEVAIVAVVLSYLAAALNGRVSLGLGLMAFGFPSAIAAGFYFSGLVEPGTASRLDMAAGLIFEFVVLLMYGSAFLSLRRQVAALSKAATQRVMVTTLLAQVGLALYFLSTEGFGLFSEGERIDFIFAGASAKFLTYGSVLLAALQAALFASRLSSPGKLQMIDYATALLTAAMSVLSGSKGAFFLWLLSALSLVDYRQARLSVGLVLSGVMVLIGTLLLTAHFVGEALGLDGAEFTSLALNRFFISNDARALAFDLQGQASASATLLSESFRSLFGLMGLAPIHPPLGQLLYESYFGLYTGAGANTSTMALVVFFSPRGEALVPALGAVVMALVLFTTAVRIRRAVRSPIVRMAMTAWGAMSLQLFTQDFLAFQLVVPLSCLGAFVLMLVDQQRPANSKAGAGRHRPPPEIRQPQAI